MGRRPRRTLFAAPAPAPACAAPARAPDGCFSRETVEVIKAELSINEYQVFSSYGIAVYPYGNQPARVLFVPRSCAFCMYEVPTRQNPKKNQPRRHFNAAPAPAPACEAPAREPNRHKPARESRHLRGVDLAFSNPTRFHLAQSPTIPHFQHEHST